MSDLPLALETAVEEDIDALVSLERLCFSQPWTPRNFRDSLADPERGRLVVLRTPSGRGDSGRGIVAYCCYDVAADEMHIHNLAVHPAERGRGLGRRLLELVLGSGARRGAAVAYLEVRASNWPARRLYGSLGFEVAQVRRGYYDRPREDALVLRKPELPALIR
ncbi:MAG TPA: ribosomal protein S18-alanine N-acetyltransferase [Vicinamibacteria bacterium]|jgi:ribosomal-protein-alanine N-acetyltransferase|nr:ribosomal protein S18-alanine N-acetyltransferase [Vicinamibacteria bacterium]